MHGLIVAAEMGWAEVRAVRIGPVIDPKTPRSALIRVLPPTYVVLV